MHNFVTHHMIKVLVNTVPLRLFPESVRSIRTLSSLIFHILRLGNHIDSSTEW